MSNYKYYWCKTQEEYDWLMNKLEKEGYRWYDTRKPTKRHVFNDYKGDTVIECKEEGGIINYSHTGYFIHETEINPTEFFSVSDIMKEGKPLISVPSHYQIEGIGDSMDTLIAIVKHNTDDVAEGIKLFNTLKYLFRYGKKNGIEDLKKARHYLDMIIEGAEE